MEAGVKPLLITEPQRAAIRGRREELAVITDTKPRQAAISSLLLQLSKFMAAGSPPRSIAAATPECVADFLAWKDTQGRRRTVVHTEECAERGLFKKESSCDCPVRMAWDSVRQYLDKLKAAFMRDLHLTAPWDAAHGCGNPADSIATRLYVDASKEQQLQAGTVPKQATLIKMRRLKICSHT